MTGWLGGLHVRGGVRGRLPVADWLCAACLQHRRATGARRVRDLLASDPITSHRAICPARKPT